MMSDLTLRQLILSLLLLTTTFTTIAVDAFSSSLRDQKRSGLSHSCRSLGRMSLFRRKKKAVQFIDENSDTNTSDDGSKREGILNKDVKKLNWLSTPQSRKSDRKKSNSEENEDRHAWKKKNNNKYAGTKRNSIVYRLRGFRMKIRSILQRNTVYVLECEDGKYYVGSTRNRKERYKQHFESSRGGSKWTRLHKPVKVIAEYKRIPTRYLMGTESQKTAECMMEYGVNNVRGAAYCISREFTTDDISDLTGFLGHYNQLDYQELYRELRKILPRPDPPASSFAPSRNNYRSSNSNSSNRNSNNTLDAEESAKAASRRKLRNYNRKQRKKRQASRKDQAKCYKCGQQGHWANECPNDGNSDNQTTLEITSTSNEETFEETLDRLFDPDTLP